MVDRRGPLAAGLTLALTAGAAAGQILLEPQEEAPLYRADLPDAVYAATRDPHLADLQLRDARGLPLSFAICPLAGSATARAAAFAHPVYDGSPLALAADGSIRPVRARPAQAGDARPVRAWVIDARAARGPVDAIELSFDAPPQLDDASPRLRASTDLRAWSQRPARTSWPAPDRLRLDIDPGPGDFFELQLADGHLPRPARVELYFPDDAPSRDLHWFVPARLTDGQYDTGRVPGVSAARLSHPATQPAGEVVLWSRQRPDHPWKPRWSGRLTLSPQPARLNFSREPDRYWKLDGVPAGSRLELAHEALELRIVGGQPAPWTLAFGAPQTRQRCGARRWQQPAAPVAIKVGDSVLAGTAAEASAPFNARGPALIVALLLFCALIVLRRLSARRLRR